MDIETLKYPVGKYKKSETIGKKEIEDAIAVLQKFPAQLKETTTNLNKTELEYMHRPDGWTVRQLVHHCADSHMNAFIRVKIALTEDTPTVKPYLEKEFAKLKDSTEAPIEWSLMTIEGVHNRLVTVLKAMSDSDYKRTYFHPEYKSTVLLQDLMGLYAWHCNHHLAHIKQALEYKNNF